MVGRGERGKRGEGERAYKTVKLMVNGYAHLVGPYCGVLDKSSASCDRLISSVGCDAGLAARTREHDFPRLLRLRSWRVGEFPPVGEGVVYGTCWSWERGARAPCQRFLGARSVDLGLCFTEPVLLSKCSVVMIAG